MEALAGAYPAKAEELGAMRDLWARKLWHQLTVALEELCARGDLADQELLVDLYRNFVAQFADKVNQLKLAHIVVSVSGHITDRLEAVEFLQAESKKIEDRLGGLGLGPCLLLKMHLGHLRLQGGEVDACREAVGEGLKSLESFPGTDPSIFASVHWLASQLHKHLKNFTEFFKSALLYLSYTSLDALPAEVQLDIAVNISLAALLSEDVYGFGELLMHPIVQVLRDHGYGWLYHLIQNFCDGDVAQFRRIFTESKADVEKQPALASAFPFLENKLAIMAVVRYVDAQASGVRRLGLADISEATSIPEETLHELLIRSFSMKLMRGTIDQVDNELKVDWIKPRVLTFGEVTEVQEKVKIWGEKADSCLAQMNKFMDAAPVGSS